MRTPLLILFLFLAGCGGGPKTSTGPICKSCKPYFVRGSWHYPQQFYEYHETGLASWYGPGFHGKPKPYGELFDQNALTAAHKTLPLPTVAKVTNLSNGRSVIVIIDDRGPFVYEGRIIDLSVAAAKAIGTYEKGVSRVRVESLVSESKALAHYLSRFGSSGRDPSGRTWRQVYDQEIGGRNRDDLTNLLLPSQTPLPTTKPINTPTSKEAHASKLDKLVHTMAKEETLKLQEGSTFIKVGEKFIQEKSAVDVVKKLPAGTPYKINKTSHSRGQNFYEVTVGPFDNQAEANKIISDMAKKGHKKAQIIEPTHKNTPKTRVKKK